jgi:hypothetical protein
MEEDDRYDIIMPPVRSEIRLLRRELNACRIALGIEPSDKIPEQEPKFGSILIDRASSRIRISPTTDEAVELQRELNEANAKLAERGATCARLALELGEQSANLAERDKKIARLREAMERTISAVTCGFGKAQRDHIIAQAQEAFAATSTGK